MLGGAEASSATITMHMTLGLTMPCELFVSETDSHHVK